MEDQLVQLLSSFGPFGAAALVGWRWIKNLLARIDRLETKLDECRADHIEMMKALAQITSPEAEQG